jgi:serine/threonine protein kinase
MIDHFGLVGQRLDGKYDIEEAVAKGGCGVVYRARHHVLNEPVAVKVLRIPEKLSAADRAAFVLNFMSEAKTIARLKHPAIVRVIDFNVSTLGDGRQTPWMVLEWIEGETLAKNLRRRKGAGGRSPQETLAILRPVFDALAYAHGEGIAHRDIKPGNLMLPVLPERPDGRTISAMASAHAMMTRVLDFGIAKIMEPGASPGSGHTQSHSEIVGFSLRYASPEQVREARTGPWTDVHALGLLLTEMLSDEPAYKGDLEMDVFTEVVSSVRPTPARNGVDVGEWENIIARALALRPDERFAHAGELLAALEASIPEVKRLRPPEVPLKPSGSTSGPTPFGSYAPAHSSAPPASGAVSSQPPTVPARPAALTNSMAGQATEAYPRTPRDEARESQSPTRSKRRSPIVVAVVGLALAGLIVGTGVWLESRRAPPVETPRVRVPRLQAHAAHDASVEAPAVTPPTPAVADASVASDVIEDAPSASEDAAVTNETDADEPSRHGRHGHHRHHRHHDEDDE